MEKRTLTADNFFSSVSLAESLINKNISYVGTLKKNKVQIPWQFLPHKDRPIHSSVMGFSQEKTLTSYVPRHNKAVVLLSTEHHDRNINMDDQNKPEIIVILK